MNMDTPTLPSRRLSKTLWYGYSPDMSDTQVVIAYTLRFGQAPQEILRGRAVVLASPVAQKGTSERATGLPGGVY